MEPAGTVLPCQPKGGSSRVRDYENNPDCLYAIYVCSLIWNRFGLQVFRCRGTQMGRPFQWQGSDWLDRRQYFA